MSVLLVIGAGAIFLAVLIGAASLLIGQDAGRVSRGIAAIEQVYAAETTSSGGSPPNAPLAGVAGGLGRALTPRRTVGWVQRHLELAGNPPNWSPNRINELQGLGALVVGVLGGLLGFGSGLFGLVVCLLLGVIVGVALPPVIVYDLAMRRQAQIRRELPDALDLLTLSVEAGQGFDAAMAHIAAVMRGPFAREIVRVLHEMQMGMRRADALRGLAGRTTVAELRTFTSAVIQAGELGIPIAHVLREQAEEMRLKRRQHADEQARKVPVKMVVPLVLCLLPAIFVIVLGPAVLMILKSGLFAGQ